jgi:hypothetical protein
MNRINQLPADAQIVCNFAPQVALRKLGEKL